MGWLNQGARSTVKALPNTLDYDLKSATQHIETININHNEGHLPTYPCVNLSVSDEKLPFIPATEVAKRKSRGAGALCVLSLPSSVIKVLLIREIAGIVVDNTVYDCTTFALSHPGGKTVIESFGGAECSWQFWRFHGAKEMREFGRALRVGRTEGLQNQFKEPVRYVGLRKSGMDEW